MTATHDVCLRCASTGPTCCMDRNKIPLTMKDVDTLNYLGYDPDRYVTVAQYCLDPEEHEPWWVDGFVAVGGRHYRASLRFVRGVCPFLSDGCVLGARRPFVCRIFPFWMSPELKLIYLGEDCPITEEMPDKAEGLTAIGESSDSIRDLWVQIKNDLVLRREEHERFVLSRLAS